MRRRLEEHSSCGRTIRPASTRSRSHLCYALLLSFNSLSRSMHLSVCASPKCEASHKHQCQRLANATALSFSITCSRAWIFLTQPLPHHHTVLFQDGRAARENPSGICPFSRSTLSLFLPLCPLQLTARGGQAGIDLMMHGLSYTARDGQAASGDR